MTKPAVVLIGADKGGVGKTTVARTLLDYFDHHKVRARAFDTEAPRGTLKRFHPDVTSVVDINYVPDQMQIFDTVNSTDAIVSMIDVRAGLLSSTLRALRDIGFIDAAKKDQITFVVFHILGPSIASLDEIAETAAYLGDAKYFMVKNFITRTSLSGTPQLTRRTSRRYLMLSILPFLSLLKWRLNRSKLLRFHSQRSSPIKRRMVTLLPTRLCFEAMFGIGLTPFGPSMIAPASLKLWLLRNLREHRSAGHVE